MKPGFKILIYNAFLLDFAVTKPCSVQTSKKYIVGISYI